LMVTSAAGDTTGVGVDKRKPPRSLEPREPIAAAPGLSGPSCSRGS
jgi:hypothetical protein